MGGLQAQYAPAMYIGLWSRLQGFERRHLTEALEKRTVAQGTLLRSTIHLVSARDYWPFAIAVRDARRQWVLRVRPDLSAKDMRSAARRLRAHLQRHSPISRKDLDAIVGKEKVGGIGLWLDLVRVPPSGTWERRRADLYAAAEDWLGSPPADLDEGAAVAHIVGKYLGAFGPAAVTEIASWAGLRPAAVSEALVQLKLRRFQAENGDELIDLVRAPRPDPDTKAPVRFLPVWDATLLVHARRTGILPEEHRNKVFNVKTPHSLNTFLVDGQVAGAWSFEKGRVRIDPFVRLDSQTRKEVEAEAARLAAVHS
jgi:hypothetical protein